MLTCASSDAQSSNDAGVTSCMDCMDLFTKRVVYQQCTIANTPRLPEHCVAWAKEMHWPQARPDDRLDTDEPEHIQWVGVLHDAASY